MAPPDDITLHELMKIMEEVKQEQKTLKHLLDSKLSKLKTDISGIIDKKISGLKKELQGGMDKFEARMKDLETQMTAMENTRAESDSTQCEHIKNSLKRLQYKSIDQESRSRRNNIIVYNIGEQENEDTGKVLRNS